MAAIFNLSEAVLIALHSLALLAREDKRSISTKEIACATGASTNTISKVMQRLVKTGFCSSARGPAGGFTLARPPHTISLLSIYETIEGKLKPLNCSLGLKKCILSKCIFGSCLTKMGNDFRRQLATHNLA